MWANCWWLSRRWSESCLPSWPQTPRIISPSDRGWMYDKWMQIKMIKTNRITAETIETGRVQSTSGQETEPNFFCSCHSYLHHTGETESYLHHTGEKEGCWYGIFEQLNHWRSYHSETRCRSWRIGCLSLSLLPQFMVWPGQITCGIVRQQLGWES